MKLGGWQRLWIFVATLYLVAVAVYALLSAPGAEAVQHQTVFYERMGPESIAVITAALDAKEVIRVRVPNGHEISFSSDTPKEQMEFISRRYFEELQDNAREERLRYFGWAVLWWLGPVSALYALGAASGWVYRGFKAS
jgi:hypothetical protein